VTQPAASHGIYSEIGCRVPQPISTWEDRPTQAQQAESEGQQLAARGPAAIWIGCINSQRFPHYADQPIQWPNSSWADQSESTTTMTTKGGIVGRGGGLVIWEARL